MPSVVHEALDFPGYWVIRWYGKLRSLPESKPQDLRLLVYLRQIAHAEQNPNECGRMEGAFVTATLPIGELTRLPLNSVLHNGLLLPQFPMLEEEHKTTLELDGNRNSLRVFDRFGKDERTGQLIIPCDQRFRRESDDEHNGWFIGFRKNDDPYAVVVPAVEVFRFFYATSDVMAKAMVSGHILDFDTHMWSKERSENPGGRAVIWLRKRMLDTDARFLARFAFNDYARLQAGEIFTRAAAQGHRERMICALPPFDHPANFNFRYRNLGGPKGDRKFVTRIVWCDCPPPYSELIWDRDNDGRFDPANRAERPPTKFKPSLIPGPSKRDKSPSTFSKSAPSGLVAPARLREKEITDRFPAFKNVPCKKAPQTETKTKADPEREKQTVRSSVKHSVVPGSGVGDTPIGKAFIEGVEVQDNKAALSDQANPSIGAAHYERILIALLAIEEKGLASVDFLSVLETECLILGVPFNVYPSTLEQKAKRWLYIDEDNLRLVLLAKIRTKESIRYVLELQQKKPGETSTIVFWAQSGIDPVADNTILATLLLDCARSGSATLISAATEGIHWARLRHSLPEEPVDPEHFLKRVLMAKPISHSKRTKGSAHDGEGTETSP